MPKSSGVSTGKKTTVTAKKKTGRPRREWPPQPSAKKSKPNLKQQIINIFAAEFKDYYGTRYVPSETDSKNVHFNVVPIAEEDDVEGFLSSWKDAVHEAFRTNIVWSDLDTDEAGRPTLSGVINRYNDLKMLASGDDGARLFYTAYARYRQIWGTDSLAAYRSAAKVLHSRGYRLAEVDARLLRRLKRRYSNRELGLELCPEEDRLRFSRVEIEAELDGNPELVEKLFRRSRGSDMPIRKRLINEYQCVQGAAR